MLKDFFNRRRYARVNTKEVKEFRKKEKSKLDKDLKNLSNTSHDKIKDSRINSRKRIDMIIDKGTFKEYDSQLETSNPLDFPEYDEKIRDLVEVTREKDGLVSGEGKIYGEKTIICVMNPDFMMGSMGSVVGEKISRAIERAIEKRLPLLIFSASGGARMQEGILSLMQMAKTSAALGRLDKEGLLYISVLTDPTTGGVTASFAMLGDIIISEPGALIGFAGPRVIEQTIKEKLPEGFQRAEFLLEKGFIDKIVERKDLKRTLAQILRLHSLGGAAND